MGHLILADGTTFEGQSFGAPVDTDGEVVFNTGMVGYPESLTDPSYRGQILVFTYPLIGNYGVPSEELNEWGFSKNLESEEIHVRGVIVTQVSEDYSHHAAVSSFDNWLKKHKIPGLTGVDTRALTKKLRETGVMLGALRQDFGNGTSDFGKGSVNIEDPNLRNLVAEVSCTQMITYEPLSPNPEVRIPTVIAYDCGMKRNIIRSFLKRGVRVVRVPWDFDLDSYKEKIDGVFISNGPGDPKMCVATIQNLKKAMDRNLLTFGICLGNQLMALAIGGDTYKLKYGHRGANQPCVETPSPLIPLPRGEGNQAAGEGRKCIITSQNHGFAVSEDLPTGWHVWWKNANDGTVEGIRHESGRFFAVQFHPEATPGPEDANYLFDEFVGLMRASTRSA
jgi:carbamoyl-phosphate synthase small subunit